MRCLASSTASPMFRYQRYQSGFRRTSVAAFGAGSAESSDCDGALSELVSSVIEIGWFRIFKACGSSPIANFSSGKLRSNAQCEPPGVAGGLNSKLTARTTAEDPCIGILKHSR